MAARAVRGGGHLDAGRPERVSLLPRLQGLSAGAGAGAGPVSFADDVFERHRGGGLKPALIVMVDPKTGRHVVHFMDGFDKRAMCGALKDAIDVLWLKAELERCR